MTNARYLRRRPQGWVFRHAIPQDLQERFGRREIVRSLAGIPQNRAASESRMLAAAIQDLFNMARENTDLSPTDLRAFAAVIGAEKRAHLTRFRLPVPGRREERQKVYEDHRDVAILAMEAVRDGRAIFDRDRIIGFADQAGISREAALAQMPLLQHAVAHATAAFNIKIATDFRVPAQNRSRLASWLLGPGVDPQDAKFDALVPTFKRPAATQDPPITPHHASEPTSAQSGDTHTSQAGRPSETENSTCALRGAAQHEAEQTPAAMNCECPAVDASRSESCSTEAEQDPDTEVASSSNVSTSPLDRSSDDSGVVVSELGPANVEEPESDDQHGLRRANQPAVEASATYGAGADEARKDEWDGRLSTIWQTIVDEKIAMGEWGISRRPELTGTIRIFMRLLGDVSVLTLTRDEASEFRRRYFTLPTDHKNMWYDREQNRERTYDELIAHVAEIESQNKSKLRRVSAKTWDKQKSTLCSAIAWIKSNRELGKNIEDPFNGLGVKRKRNTQAIRLERDMATTPSLTMLFASPCWTRRANEYHLIKRGDVIVRDSLYWVPLFEICLGMRREEVCQLRIKHFTRKFAFLGIDLFADDINVKVADGASRRWVPLSDQMLALGVVESLVLNRGPEELLFPELSSDNAHGTYGDAYGKRLLNYIKNVPIDFRATAEAICVRNGVAAADRGALIQREQATLELDFRKKTNNHAIRHWFKTTLENLGCKTIFVEEVMGHANTYQKTEGGRYMKEVFVENLKATVDMVPLPFDPDELRRLAEQAEQKRKTSSTTRARARAKKPKSQSAKQARH